MFPHPGQTSPASPVRVRALVVRVALALLGCLLLALVGRSGAPATAAATTDGFTATPLWSTGIWGTGIGQSGITVENLDDDPEAELIAGGGYDFGRNQFWQILSFDQSSRSYLSEWRSKEYDEWIDRIVVADGPPEVGRAIFVLRRSGTVEVYDAADRRFVQSFDTPPDSLANTMLAADIDRDGGQELVVLKHTRLQVYDPATFSLEWECSLPENFTTGTADLAAGNLDADASIEIATDHFVIDVDTRSIQVDRRDQYYPDVEIADVDGDGTNELLWARWGWNQVLLFDVATQTVERTIVINGGCVITTANLDADSAPEILCGSRLYGVIAYDGATGQRLWSIPSPSQLFGFTTLVVADPDNDHELELLWGAGYESTNTDRLFVVNLATHQLEWRNTDIGGPLNAVAAGDLDADGREEIVSLPMRSDGWERGSLFVYDAASGKLVRRFGQSLSVLYPNPVFGFAVGDTDGDGADDVVVGGVDQSSAPNGGALLVFDGGTGTLRWRSPSISGVTFAAVKVADLDGDGAPEVVAGQRQVDTSGTAHLVVYDGATGAEEWHTPALGAWGGVSTIAVANLDADAALEIAFSTTGSNYGALVPSYAYVYDGGSRALQMSTAFTGVASVAIASLTRSGRAEWLLGMIDGRLLTYDGVSMAQTRNLQVASSSVTAMSAYLPAGRDDALIAIAVSGQVGILDPATRAFVWSSPFLGADSGAGGHLSAADLNHDNRFELLVGGRSAVYLWRDESSDVIAPPTPTSQPTATPSPTPTSQPTATPSPTPTSQPTATPSPTRGPADAGRISLLLPLVQR